MIDYLSLLSPRQRVVLALTLHGITSKQAAKMMHGNARTIEAQRQKAYNRLGVSGRDAALALLQSQSIEIERIALPIILYYHSRCALEIRERMVVLTRQPSEELS